ncbi:MAG: hypothetical protein LBS67_04705, partial [Clostridiales Family XIII bacterium]|nr:hypothetical protein [Clostridiales Family XIII bacterium]
NHFDESYSPLPTGDVTQTIGDLSPNTTYYVQSVIELNRSPSVEKIYYVSPIIEFTTKNPIDLSKTTESGDGYEVSGSKMPLPPEEQTTPPTPVDDPDRVLTITEDGDYEIIQSYGSGTSLFKQIEVDPYVNATITIKDIDVTSKEGQENQVEKSTFTLKPGTAINLILEGENSLRQAHEKGNAALDVSDGAAVTISGIGSLTATSGGAGAGIGGRPGERGGTITIDSGTVTAQGGAGSAGIGGCEIGEGSITINGGNVAATGGLGGAGIGGGGVLLGAGVSDDLGGSVKISGGTVTAIGSAYSAGIGGGIKGCSGLIEISSKADVTAIGGNLGAGIGSGYDFGGSPRLIQIKGGVVRATGGPAGAGIGGGSASSTVAIEISGVADVAATGGADLGEYTAGAGIGGGGSGIYGTAASANISISPSAVVKAFAASATPGSSGKRAIDASENNAGGAYYVNAYLDVAPQQASRLDVYAGGGDDKTGELTLPAGYAGFAYVTGNEEQNDKIMAYKAEDGAALGKVVRVEGNSSEITSTNGNAALAVKLLFTGPYAIDLSTTIQNGVGYTVSGTTMPSSPSQQITDPDRVLTFKAGEEERTYHITQSGGNGTSLYKQLVVEEDVEATISIGGIDVTSKEQDKPTFALGTGADIDLILQGSNSLSQTASATGNNAALSVPAGATVSISGAGSLTATGGAGGAGIGGGANQAAGTITIASGAVTATGGTGGAGIGGVNDQAAGTITITNGDVTATGGTDGAGIGGGALNIAHAARVIAYASSSAANGKRAIDATGGNGGSGYYVNAYFSAPVSNAPVTLDVYDAESKLYESFNLPANYAGFAYSTRAESTQDDAILVRSGDVPLGQLARVADNSPVITSTKGSQALNVKFRTTSLKVSNAVTGAYADDTKDFTFTVTFTNKDDVPFGEGQTFAITGGGIGNVNAPILPSDKKLTTDEYGKATFTLRHGQWIKIDDIVKDGKVRIVESNYSGYTPSFVDSWDNTGVPVEDDDTETLSMVDYGLRTIDFTNTRETVVISGIVDAADSAPFIILAAGLLALLWFRRKAVAMVRFAEAQARIRDLCGDARS